MDQLDAGKRYGILDILEDTSKGEDLRCAASHVAPQECLTTRCLHVCVARRSKLGFSSVLVLSCADLHHYFYVGHRVLFDIVRFPTRPAPLPLTHTRDARTLSVPATGSVDGQVVVQASVVVSKLLAASTAVG